MAVASLGENLVITTDKGAVLIDKSGNVLKENSEVGFGYDVTVYGGKVLYLNDQGMLYVLDDELGVEEGLDLKANPSWRIVSGDGVVFVSCLLEGVKMLDVSGDNLQVIGSITDAKAAYAMHYDRESGRLYIADLGNGLIVVDVSDPKNPMTLAIVRTVGHINDVLKEGDLIYTTGVFGFAIVREVENK